MITLPASSRWEKLNTRRAGVLDRARDCSALTIPHILPPEGHTESDELATPYQGLGARGVNNVSSKLLLALFPPNSPFFKYAVNDVDVQKLTGDQKLRTQVERGLAEVERSVMSDIESSNTRVVMFEAIKHLVVTGNVLVYQEATGQLRMWKLDQFVVRRDGMGTVLEIIIREEISPSVLEQDVIEACNVTETDEVEKNVALYTVITRGPNSWTVHQEINDIQVPDSTGSYPLDKPAYLALRMSALAGEDYGRGLVEEYLGDLRSLEGITEAIVVAAAASAKILFMRSPNAATRAKDIANARSGDIITGLPEDVRVLQVEKYPDLRVALEVANELTQRLSHAFLLNTAVQRNAERVTAEEIRYMAQELEDAQGGIYSVLTQELQYPFIKRRMSLMQRANKLPTLPKEVKPVITTGLEALGRGHDVSKLRAVLEDLAPLGPEVIAKHMNIADYIQRVVTARGVDSDNLIKSAEEIAQEQQQAMLMQTMQGAAPGVLQEAVKGMGQQGKPNG